ncbi:MAG TPA: hypothetical protein VJQ54_04820 [Candidatus Sulfotelmatobacter sp.]|nr:hypothetical protein [Candidatus Sulfotelmatobacter sp.]
MASFLTAAELTARGFIVSTTSRNAIGADLLVTDQQCKRAWSVQVKTNGTPANFWLLNTHAERFNSESHVYVFVNLKGSSRPDYFVLPSAVVAANMYVETAKTGTVWYSFLKDKAMPFKEGWELFGDPGGSIDAASAAAV